MEPEDKARELVAKMLKWQFKSDDNALRLAKQCALVVVDEMIGVYVSEADVYWLEIKTEIEKL